MITIPWLSLLIFIPWLGALVLSALPRLSEGATRALGYTFSLSTFGIGGWLLNAFDPSRTDYQFVENHAWIEGLGVSYRLGMDGMSLLLVLLTGLIAPLALLASAEVQRAPRLFHALFLFLQGSALGVFLALNFFPWFIFWELSLVPAYFLVKLWGGKKSARAGYLFFVYTMAGSAFLLLGFVGLYAAANTFDFERLAAMAREGALTGKLGSWGFVLFLGVLLGLAVKAPLYPFHSWLPGTYAEAPTGVTMFLTAVMSKMGVYGFLRILWPFFPHELNAAASVLIVLALAGVVLGAFAAMTQTDLKRMLAYSSLNHVSYCLLALFAVAHASGRQGVVSEAASAALSGTLLQLFNHGLSAAALFYCVGRLESRSGGERGLNDFGGIRSAAPVFAGLSAVSLFSSLGLPGLNGFVGEFLIFRGVFGLAPSAAAIGCLGLFATALFLLTFFQRVFHGAANRTTVDFKDLSSGEVAVLLPLVILMILLGVCPRLMLDLINPLVASWATHLSLP